MSKRFTLVSFVLGTVVAFLLGLLPWVVGMSGVVYLVVAVALNAVFLRWALAAALVIGVRLPLGAGRVTRE